MKQRHKWSIADDIIAFYLYRYSTKDINYTYDEISNRLGMSIDSLKMRKANYKSLDKGIGLPDVSKQTDKVFEFFKNIDHTEFRIMVEKLLA
ncbi:hypothetical protein C7M56_03295 [Clostridium botulinum]|uniref:Uncharacterized protein n=1 Tax=Clostridium botulinum TaxID=1491 RepID=A0ABC8CRU5_CLOBO|nr:hypothetical protein [Clostridium botulinum]AVQ37758.1 hypothetical protein C7M56_03295 [Clostridium botulinum]